MIVKQYIELTTAEMYAIWWHMGFNGNYENDTAAGASFEKYPLALALYTADMMASRLMEAEAANKALFAEPPGFANVVQQGRNGYALGGNFCRHLPGDLVLIKAGDRVENQQAPRHLQNPFLHHRHAEREE